MGGGGWGGGGGKGWVMCRYAVCKYNKAMCGKDVRSLKNIDIVHLRVHSS